MMGLEAFRLGTVELGGVNNVYGTWNSSETTPCSWASVSCSGQVVTSLVLSYQNLSGTISPDLALVANLVVLDLRSNQFYSSIPSSLSALTGLTTLLLSSNYLSGTIPSQLGLLTNLRTLYLFTNLLSGTLPSQIFIPNLLSFAVYNNLLYGSIPTSIGDMPDVATLSLRNNEDLYSTIPSEIGRLTNVSLVRLSGNKLTGQIPSEVGLLQRLNTFSLCSNSLSGPIPSEMGLLTALVELLLYSNLFTGNIPDSFANLMMLQYFYVQSNSFVGNLPAVWDTSTSLMYVDISNSGLTCNLTTICRMAYMVRNGVANELKPNRQPQRINPNNVAKPFTSFILETWCVSAAAACNNLVTAYVKVTATVSPADSVKAGSLVGNVVSSEEGYVTFLNFNFLGLPNISYQIVFTATGLAPLQSAIITVQECPLRLPNSIQDTEDPYNCVCLPSFFRSGFTCEPCPLHTFKPNASATADSLGSYACGSIPCANGEYLNGTACVPCGINQDTGGASGAKSVDQCVCVKGTYREYPSRKCKECVPGLNCEAGGDNIAVSPGYWRSNNLTTIVTPCPFGLAACPGQNVTGTEYRCSEGYSGVACAVCVHGRYMGDNACKRCPSKAVSVSILCVSIFLSLAIIYFLFISSRRGTEAPRHMNHLDSCLKVLLTFLQSLFYLGLMKVEWASLPFQFLSMSGAASFTFDVASFDCLFPDLHYYDKLIVIFFLPLILISLAFAFTVLRDYLFLHNTRQSLNDFQLIVMILLYIFHPMLFQTSVTVFQCVAIPGTGTEYLTHDYSVDCRQPLHTFFLFASIAFIIFYIFGSLALLGFRGLRHNALSGKLFKAGTFSNVKYSFFIRPFREDCYYWEITVMIRKLALVLFSGTMNGVLQLFWANILIALSIIFQITRRPFHSLMVNSLETIALVGVYLTIVIGIHCLTEPSVQSVLSVVLIIINCSVIAYILWYSLLEGRKKFAETVIELRNSIGIAPLI